MIKAAEHKNTSGRVFRLRLVASLVIPLVIAFSFFPHSTKNRNLREVPTDEFTSYLDGRIAALMDDYGIPGVTIALIKEADTIRTAAYGYADLAEKRLMTPETPCRVESISKSVTAWGVIRLAEQGKIDLDKPVKDYIQGWKFPDSEFPVQKITTRQLLSNTSGLPLGDFLERYAPDAQKPSLEESLFRQAVLTREPGNEFLYSNVGYNLLELLIEDVSGQDFAEYMKAEVLIPLGMRGSDFELSGNQSASVPVGYNTNGNPVPVYVYPEKGSGGLFSTAGDIAAFVEAGMTDFSPSGNAVLSPESVSVLYAPAVEKPGIYSLVFDAYGFGYYIETLPNGMRSIANGGQGSGVMTFFQAVPETGDGIVILTNSQRSWPFFGHIISDWAEWNGFGSAGMGKIVTAQKTMWILMGLSWAVLLWLIWGLLQELLNGSRVFAPLSKEKRPSRVILTSSAVIVSGVLIWCMSRDYLFISSLFPNASNWLWGTLSVLALVLFSFALLPGGSRRKEQL